MKKVAFSLTCFLIGFQLMSQSSKDILPSAGWQEGWEANDVLFYEGDDLFFLINGAADLYMEFGFSDVAAVDYIHPEKGRLYVEVYRMDSDSAAFGAFSMNKGNTFLKIEPSPWIIFENKFMSIWKSNYYITISGVDFAEKGMRMDYFILMANIIEGIDSYGTPPSLFKELYYEKPTQHFTYILGPLALNNIYSLGFQDVFNVNQAVMLEYDDYKIITFEYESTNDSKEAFNSVMSFMESSNRFSDFKILTNNTFSAKDHRGLNLLTEITGSRIKLSIN